MQNVRRMGYLLTLILGIALTTAMLWKPAPPRVFVGIVSAEVPKIVKSYAADADYEQPLMVRQALGFPDIVSRVYRSGDQSLDFTLIGGTDRSALHDPRSCLIGAGNDLMDTHSEILPGTNITAQTCHVLSRSGGTNFDMLYVYVVDGHCISQVTQIRAAMLWSAVLGRKNTPVYFLRFMQPLPSNPAEATAAHARLNAFAAKMWVSLEPKLITTH